MLIALDGMCSGSLVYEIQVRERESNYLFVQDMMAQMIMLLMMKMEVNK